MGITMTGVIECWIEKSEYTIGHWVDFAEIQYNKWYELHRTIYKYSGNFSDSDLSFAMKKVIHNDTSHGLCVLSLEELETIWKDFNFTAKATIEFMRTMGRPTRLFIYFN